VAKPPLSPAKATDNFLKHERVKVATGFTVVQPSPVPAFTIEVH
jgi:hypothetical protein